MYKKEILDRVKLINNYEYSSLYNLRAYIRTNYSIHLEIFYSLFHNKWSVNNYIIDTKKGKRAVYKFDVKSFDSYDDALEYNILILLDYLNIK